MKKNDISNLPGNLPVVRRDLGSVIRRVCIGGFMTLFFSSSRNGEGLVFHPVLACPNWMDTRHLH